MTVEGSPHPKNPILKVLGIATAIIVALTALIVAIKHFSEAVRPEPAKPIPVLAATDVGNIKGSGHTVLTECEKQRQLYAVQNPDFEITIDQNVQPSSDKDLLGTVTYTFHCHFNATAAISQMTLRPSGPFGSGCRIRLVSWWISTKR